MAAPTNLQVGDIYSIAGTQHVVAVVLSPGKYIFTPVNSQSVSPVEYAAKVAELESEDESLQAQIDAKVSTSVFTDGLSTKVGVDEYADDIAALEVADADLAAQIDGLSGAGTDGLGWTGGSYNASTGIVTFTSDDGLGFATGDLRGADGQDGAGISPPTLVTEVPTTGGAAGEKRYMTSPYRLFECLATDVWVEVELVASSNPSSGITVYAPTAIGIPYLAIVMAEIDSPPASYTATWSLPNAHANSKIIGLDGDWPTPTDKATHVITDGRSIIHAAVWVWGTSVLNNTVTCTISGESASTMLTVTPHAASYNLATPNTIINDQTELDALIAGGGTTNTVYLRAGFYPKNVQNFDALQHVETHPDDWFAGTPAVFTGDGTHGVGGDSHRFEVTTRDNFILRRVGFYNTYWTTAFFQGVDSPLVSNVFQWESYDNLTFQTTTNGVIRDFVSVGAMDYGDNGEDADSIVIADTVLGSNNECYRAICLASSDDGCDGWQSHSTTWHDMLIAFNGKGSQGDGNGLKLNGGPGGSGGNRVYSVVTYDVNIGFTGNASVNVPDPASYFHNLFPINSRNRDYYFDSTDKSDVRNCITLNANNGQGYGGYSGSNNSWQLGITPDMQTAIGPFHLTWEGFRGSSLGEANAGSPTIDAGTSTNLDAGYAIVNGTPDVGAFEYNATTYASPTPPEGLTQSS